METLCYGDVLYGDVLSRRRFVRRRFVRGESKFKRDYVNKARLVIDGKNFIS
jgi:hypothetical protein